MTALKENDIKVGNWVRLYVNHEEYTEFACQARDIVGIGTGCDQYYGVPLTEEWLERFGFEKIKESHFDKWQLIESPFTWSDGCLNISGKVSITNIKHVHKLQNLYFALTGEELKYSLNSTPNKEES